MNVPQLAKLSVSQEIQQDEDLGSAVHAATKRLVTVLGNSAGGVTVDWSATTDSRNRPVLQLKLSEINGNVQAQFAPDEFDSEWHLQRRLYSLWGDLLHSRSRRELKELKEAVHQLQGE